MPTSIRAFNDADYARYIEIYNNAFPDTLVAEDEQRYRDDTWDRERYYKHRVMIADETGRLVGSGDLSHIFDQFHPDKYNLEITVDPADRRHGFGAALYDYMAAKLAERGALTVRSWVRESEPDSNKFATDRGFVEVRREWQSRLDVAGFDPAPFAGASERAAAAGIEITDLAMERERNPNVLRDLHELHVICSRDVPDVDPVTDMPYDEFLKYAIEGPAAIPSAYQLARHGDRYVALAWMEGSVEEPDVLYQGLTGVIPEYRGKGIAMALKLANVERARDLGKREIRTWNDTLNRAMLRINEAMGFTKQPADIVYLKTFGPDPTPADAPANP